MEYKQINKMLTFSKNSNILAMLWGVTLAITTNILFKP